MNDLPIQTILFPIIAFAAVALILVRQKKVMAQAEKTYANFRLADIAQRMQLSIVQGDPGFNLMMANANHGAKSFEKKKGFIAALSDEGSKESRVLLRGAPNGRPTELAYSHKTDREQILSGTVHRHTFDCRLTVQVAQPFAPFEVTLRNPAAGMASPPVMSLLPAFFGDPLLDAKFALHTTDPRIGPAIAAALGPLANIAFLHIRASDQSIASVATMMGASVAFYSIEQVQYCLDQMGLVLEGRSPGQTI